MSVIEIYMVAIVHVCTVPVVLYPLVYRGTGWREGPTGRALMAVARSLALVFIIAILGFWWPFPGYDYIYSAALTYLTFALSYQLRTMYRLKRHGQQRRRLLAHYTLHPEGDHDGRQAPAPVRQDHP